MYFCWSMYMNRTLASPVTTPIGLLFMCCCMCFLPNYHDVTWWISHQRFSRENFTNFTKCDLTQGFGGYWNIINFTHIYLQYVFIYIYIHYTYVYDSGWSCILYTTWNLKKKNIVFGEIDHFSMRVPHENSRKRGCKAEEQATTAGMSIRWRTFPGSKSYQQSLKSSTPPLWVGQLIQEIERQW